MKTVLVTGGAGYVGSALVPKLLEKGYTVRVFDLYLFGKQVFDSIRGNPNLQEMQADLRNPEAVREAVTGCDAVIHLACISNDPSFELDPGLGKSINFDCFPQLVQASKDAGVKRFVYASSSSVYGVKKEPNVSEELALEPLTDYSKYKALCEDILLEAREPGFCTLIVRPATVCGYAPRQRLDLIVNILTSHALTKGVVTILGGEQMRPNIHIEDMCQFYVSSLEWDEKAIDGKIYNAGFENYTVTELAALVQRVVGDHVTIETKPTDDLRSYQICSDKIQRELGFKPRHTVESAVQDLVAAFKSGLVPDPMTTDRYYNIKTMQKANLK